MGPGDIVLTPQWRWHGHANDSGAPALWIDVLDVPYVQKTENIFFEHHPDTLETATASDPDSPMRLKAADIAAAARSPNLVRVGEALTPTMALAMRRLAQGESAGSPPAIDNRILIVADGGLRLEADGLEPTSLVRGDIAVIPSWTAHALRATDREAVVLTVSDAPIFERLTFRNPLEAA